MILRSARGSVPYKVIRQLIGMTNTTQDPVQGLLEAELGYWGEVGRRNVRRVASLLRIQVSKTVKANYDRKH